MNKKLKIYIIEDDEVRRQNMQSYFESVNKLLKGNEYDKNCDYKDCHLCFQEFGFQEVELQEILSEKRDGKYVDYVFNEEAAWVKEIEKILVRKEYRIFIIDFALNSRERTSFQTNESTLRAVTANNILNYINDKTLFKEYIIFESVVKNMVSRLKAILDIGMTKEYSNVKYDCLLGNYFKAHTAVTEKVSGISDAFTKAMKEITDE